MSQQIPTAFKQCAVCNFWGGGREPDFTATRVTVESSSARGKCLLQGGPWKGQDKQASQSCNKWAKWAALK